MYAANLPVLDFEGTYTTDSLLTNDESRVVPPIDPLQTPGIEQQARLLDARLMRSMQRKISLQSHLLWRDKCVD